MKINLTVSIVIILLSSLCYAQKQVEKDCTQIYSALKIYFSNMQPENAEKIIDLISGDSQIHCKNSDIIRDEYFTTHSYLLELFTNNLENIKTRLNRKDEKAQDLLFYWDYFMSDGFYSEEISKVIGSAMDIDPSFFLHGLYRNKKLIDRLSPIVLMHIAESFYIAEQRCAAYEKTINSIQTINDSKLDKIKYDVLQILIQAKEEDCKALTTGSSKDL